MKIKEVEIFNFGKLQNCRFQFEPGINVIYGENEAGKTTLHHFLTAMLFGMEKGKGRAAAGSPYIRYEPWHAPSYYSGAMHFEVGEKPFYLERNFYYKERKDILRNEEDGEELSVAYGDLAVLLGSITKEAFGNTYDIPQSGAATGKELADILAEYLSDAAKSGGGGTPVARAVTALLAKKKEKNACLKMQKEERQQEVNVLQVERRLLEQDCSRLRNEIAETESALYRMKKEYRIKEEKAHTDTIPKENAAGRNEKDKKRKQYCFGIAGVSVVVLILQFLVHSRFDYSDLLFWISQIALFLIILASVGFGALANRKTESVVCVADKKDIRVTKNQEDEEPPLQTAVLQVEKMLGNLRDSLTEKETRLYNVIQSMEKAMRPGTKELELAEDVFALELAASEIKRLAQELCEDMGDELNAEVSGWISKITGGRYDSITVDANGVLRVIAEGRELSPEALSRGTLEQIYLSLRLAVGNIVSKEEALPIFLDEAFVMYDDVRLTDTLKALEEEKKQIFIFTCQKREMSLLKQAGITYHKVWAE